MEPTFNDQGSHEAKVNTLITEIPILSDEVVQIVKEYLAGDVTCPSCSDETFPIYRAFCALRGYFCTYEAEACHVYDLRFHSPAMFARSVVEEGLYHVGLESLLGFIQFDDVWSVLHQYSAQHIDGETYYFQWCTDSIMTSCEPSSCMRKTAYTHVTRYFLTPQLFLIVICWTDTLQRSAETQKRSPWFSQVPIT